MFGICECTAVLMRAEYDLTVEQDLLERTERASIRRLAVQALSRRLRYLA